MYAIPIHRPVNCLFFFFRVFIFSHLLAAAAAPPAASRPACTFTSALVCFNLALFLASPFFVWCVQFHLFRCDPFPAPLRLLSSSLRFPYPVLSSRDHNPLPSPHAALQYLIINFYGLFLPLLVLHMTAHSLNRQHFSPLH